LDSNYYDVTINGLHRFYFLKPMFLCHACIWTFSSSPVRLLSVLLDNVRGSGNGMRQEFSCIMPKHYWPRYDKFSLLVVRWVILFNELCPIIMLQVIQVLSSHYYLASSEIDPFSVILLPKASARILFFPLRLYLSFKNFDGHVNSYFRRYWSLLVSYFEWWARWLVHILNDNHSRHIFDLFNYFVLFMVCVLNAQNYCNHHYHFTKVYSLRSSIFLGG
jgi:hypothetical protein